MSLCFVCGCRRLLFEITYQNNSVWATNFRCLWFQLSSYLCLMGTRSPQTHIRSTRHQCQGAARKPPPDAMATPLSLPLSSFFFDLCLFGLPLSGVLFGSFWPVYVGCLIGFHAVTQSFESNNNKTTCHKHNTSNSIDKNNRLRELC